jgi:hypothetical protein
MGIMTEDEYKNKLTEYINRYNFWTEKTINQLGYSVNLFTTLGIAFLIYLLKNNERLPHFDIRFDSVFNFALTSFISATLSIFLSIVCGFISILCRLLDFRITRHLALTRKRYLSKNKREVLNNDRKSGLIDSKIINISNEKYFKILWKYLWGNVEFIKEGDFVASKVVEKFEKLRTESTIFGDFTWKSHICQIVLFLIGILLYGLTIL